MMKKLIGCICCCGMVLSVAAQSTVRPLRQLSSPELVNPAYYNQEAGISADLFYRHQWGKLDKAPQLAGFSLHNMWSKKWGTGINGGLEKSGYRKDYNLGLTADKGFRLSENSILAAGITLGVQLQRYDWPASLSGIEDGLKPEDFNKERFYLTYGLSWTFHNLSLGAGHTALFRDGGEGLHSVLSVYGEYKLGVGTRWELTPRALYVYDNDWGSDLDIGAFAYYRNMAGIGIVWRKEHAVGIQGEVRFLKCLALTYCYEPSTGSDADVFGASHEVGLKFNSGGLFKKK